MTNSTGKKWQSILNFMEAIESSSTYPDEQIRQLQTQVAELKARVERTERSNSKISG